MLRGEMIGGVLHALGLPGSGNLAAWSHHAQNNCRREELGPEHGEIGMLLALAHAFWHGMPLGHGARVRIAEACRPFRSGGRGR